jgi:hypothetical protein
MSRRALCYDEAECLGVFADARISRDDGDQLWGLAKQLQSCEMHGIERTDRLNRKRAADTSQYCSVHIEDEAASLERPQGPNSPLFFFGSQPSPRAGSDDGPTDLCKSQSRGYVMSPDRRRLHGRPVMLQQCCNQCA